MFRIHNSLGPQVAPTGRPQSVLGGRAIYTRPNAESLPAPSTGIATCLIRATGTAGLAPAGLRPCLLLPSPFPPPFHFPPPPPPFSPPFPPFFPRFRL